MTTKARPKVTGAVYRVFQSVCDACPWASDPAEDPRHAETKLAEHVEHEHGATLEVRFRGDAA